MRRLGLVPGRCALITLSAALVAGCGPETVRIDLGAIAPTFGAERTQTVIVAVTQMGVTSVVVVDARDGAGVLDVPVVNPDRRNQSAPMRRGRYL